MNIEKEIKSMEDILEDMRKGSTNETRLNMELS